MYGLFIYTGYEYERVPLLLEVSNDYKYLYLKSAQLVEKDYSNDHFGDLQSADTFELVKHNDVPLVGWVILDLTEVKEPAKWFKDYEERLLDIEYTSNHLCA